MRTTRLCILAALPLALAACGGDDAVDGAAADSTAASLPGVDSAATAAAPAPSSDPGAPMAGAVSMNALGGSGVTGLASFMVHGAAETMVTVNLAAAADGTHSGHIHQGTCAAPGPVVAPLQDVTIAGGSGSAAGTVPLALATVMNGQHVVAYHQSSGAQAGAPIVCGQITALASADSVVE